MCSDPERPWFPQLSVCYPSMHEQAAQAKWHRLHEKAPWHDVTFTSWREEPDEDHPYHFSHGTTVWVDEIDHGYGGDFLTEESPSLQRVEEVEPDDREHQH